MSEIEQNDNESTPQTDAAPEPQQPKKQGRPRKKSGTRAVHVKPPALVNSVEDTPGLPPESGRHTREPFFPNYPKNVYDTERDRPIDRRRAWLARMGLPKPTKHFRCCTTTEGSQGKPVLPYECYAVDESEAKLFYMRTMSLHAQRSKITVTRLDGIE